MEKKIIYAAFFLLLLSTSALAQTTFFVAPAGKDTNPGSKENNLQV
jgi:hypothetical protein